MAGQSTWTCATTADAGTPAVRRCHAGRAFAAGSPGALTRRRAVPPDQPGRVRPDTELAHHHVDEDHGERQPTATSAPNRSVSVRVAVSARATGRAVLTLDRMDPFAGWLHVRQQSVLIRGGTGTYRFTPQPAGRWRFSAGFLGSRLFAPSSWARPTSM